MAGTRAHRYDYLLASALNHPWAVLPETLSVIAWVLAHRLAGDDPDPVAITEARSLREAREARTAAAPDLGGVALIPMQGVIFPHANELRDASGTTSFDGLSAALSAALADPAIKTIVFQVDSPGGNVAGATEFARQVLSARAVKPIIASVSYTGASAAYWAIAGATEIVAAPSALVGGIGVYTLYDDLSAAIEQLGIKREVISAGTYKAEGVGGAGLTEAARAHIQQLIDGAYGRFVGDVARGRGATPAAVRKGFGEGRVLDAEAAKAAGLVDRIATLDDTLSRVARSTPRHASAESPPPATSQEPSPATDQEPAAVLHDAALIELEQRVLALVTKD